MFVFRTDAVLLAIAFSSSILLNHLFVQLCNAHTGRHSFIDVKSIATNFRQHSIDPNIVLVLHALSGCETTSHIRNITKEKMFQRFFDYPARYSSIVGLGHALPPQDAIDAAEELLINCYSFGCASNSLDDLRAMSKRSERVHSYFSLDPFRDLEVRSLLISLAKSSLFLSVAAARVKDRSRKNIAASLPPSSMAFREHCLRCSRQLKTWFDSLESNSIAPPMSDSGFEYSSITNRFKIKWTTLSDHPVDPRLQTCGDCKTGCTRCKCYKSNLSCTFFCKCDADICSNRVRTYYWHWEAWVP